MDKIDIFYNEAMQITATAVLAAMAGMNNKNTWAVTGEVGLLPLDARLRLRKAASIENRRDRLIAMSEAEAWVKSTYPQYFNQKEQ